VSCGSGPYLPAQEDSDAATCLTALDPASLLERAPTLSRVPRLRILPPCLGGLRRCHMSRGSQWATGLKKWLADQGMQLGLRVFKARSSVIETLARCLSRRRHHDQQIVQMDATFLCYSTTTAQLITPGHCYSGDATRQDNTTSLALFSTAG
jgi:hypothetical protein